MFHRFIVLLACILLLCSCSNAVAHTPTIHDAHLGSTLNDFTLKYGPGKYFPPSTTANEPHYAVPAFYLFTDKNTTYLFVTLARGVVSSIDIIGPDNWSQGQLKAYCTQLEPGQGNYHLTFYAPNAAVLAMT